jgi:Fe-S-cluster containining protein
MMQRPMAADPARASELALLCRSCGMCCDGSLFGRVDLQPDEIDPARRRGLSVLESGKAFEQPCVALAPPAPCAERACAIYAARPRSCRRFTCRLYASHAREGGAIEERLAVVRRVRSLVAELEASGLTPADVEVGSGEDAAYRELTRILEESFARAG